jgi:nitrite reductase/ring-hydroxylating ferredoxin subunit
MKTKLSRRQLLLGTALVVGGSCLCKAFGADAESRSTCSFTPVLPKESYTFDKQSVRLELAKAPCLDRSGSAAHLLVNDDLQLMVVRAGRNKYHVVSRLCTHARQTLSYVPERRLLMCNGFNHSLFDLDGKVAKGPAEGALKTYPCVLKGGCLDITV